MVINIPSLGVSVLIVADDVNAIMIDPIKQTMTMVWIWRYLSIAKERNRTRLNTEGRKYREKCVYAGVREYLRRTQGTDKR